MNTPMVSVIINCYNSEKYLSEAIDSVLEQTFQDWELIFWDNKSTDNSADIFKSYNDPRMSYYYAPEHTNLGQARINALEKASAKWISYLDADDLWLPEKIEKQIALFKRQSDVGLVYSNAFTKISNIDSEVLTNKHIIIPQIFVDDPLKYLLQVCFIPWPTVMFDREKLEFSGGLKNYAFAVDYDLCLKLAFNSRLGYIPDFLSVYRIHDGNMSANLIEQGYLDGLSISMKYTGNKNCLVGHQCHRLKLFIYYLKNTQFRKTLPYLGEFIKDPLSFFWAIWFSFLRINQNKL